MNEMEYMSLRIMKIVKIYFLALLLFTWSSVLAYEDAVCKNGTVTNTLNYIECCVVYCLPGQQANWCKPEQPSTSHCAPCEEDTYNNEDHGPIKLGDENNCKMKKKCQYMYMITISDGSPTEDRQCGCIPGYKYDEKKHICRTDLSDAEPKNMTVMIKINETGNGTTVGTTTNLQTEENRGMYLWLILLVLIPIIVIIMVIYKWREKIFIAICKKRKRASYKLSPSEETGIS